MVFNILIQITLKTVLLHIAPISHYARHDFPHKTQKTKTILIYNQKIQNIF